MEPISTYDHRLQKASTLVSSYIFKLQIGMLVVWSVTTCESILLYVFCIFGFDFLNDE